MAIVQRKNQGKRGGAIQDITIKRPQSDSFEVRSIQQEQDAVSVQPLQDAFDELQDEVLDQVEELEEEHSYPEREKERVVNAEPHDFVKVKFPKFVQLVSTHDCTEVMRNYENADIVMSSDLLTELAGTHDEKEEKKIPLVFIVGIAIGVVLTYLLLNK